MKKFILITLLFLGLGAMAFQMDVTDSETQESSIIEYPSIDTFITNNPECLGLDVVYEGCKLLLSSDGDYLFGQLNILNPELQMRLLMQGVTFYIDPTGKKKEKYSVVFPSGLDVKNTLAQPEAPEEGSIQSEEEVRPDIKPLINALNNAGITFDQNGSLLSLDKGDAGIWINETDNSLSYTFLIPVENLLKEKKIDDSWSVGIFSAGGSPGANGPGMGGPGNNGTGGGPGMGGPGFGMPGNGNSGFGMPPRRQENNTVSEDFRNFMMNDIDKWYNFSFSQISSLN